MQARRDAALNGLLNNVDAPTKCPDLNYTVIADSPLLGFIQIDEEGARNGHTKNSTYLNGTDSFSTGQTSFRLVLPSNDKYWWAWCVAKVVEDSHTEVTLKF